MRIPKWICEECEQTFTRRWNANRHCNNIHYGRLDCVILFRHYLSKKGNNRFLHLSDRYSENNNQLFYQENLSFQERIHPMVQTKFNLPLDPLESYLDKEILLYRKLDELGPKYEQLENLFSHLPRPKRTSIVGSILNTAINSENPNSFINNQVEEFRRAKIRNRMLDDISASLGFNKNITMEFLKMGLN